MAKKTLKQKLHTSIFWVIGASAVFGVVGALLISDGPKPDPAKIYGIGKDALFICAAFLAPVIAYVLLNDWRQEHLEKKLEADSELIFKKINDIYLKLFEVRMSVCKEITLEENEGLRVNMIMELLTVEINRVRNHINLLKEDNINVSSFIRQSNEIIKSLSVVNLEFYDIQNKFVQLSKVKKPYDYLSPICITTKTLKGNDEKINELNELCKKLQVKREI
ncbi:hypothetical protein [Acinetobacter gerneri]|uniref:hypothetical protein n=1 Tax=Acinetobacter gerneri TaxID=202952 RepID=UPI003A879F5E